MAIVSFGELLIDFVALESGVTVGEASGFIAAPGGAPANVAAAVARLGVASAFLGQVGDDPFGRQLAAVLRDLGIDTRGLRFSSEARTMLAFVSLAANGERSFVFYRHPSADMLMTPADVNTDVIDAARIFHYGSITLIGEPSRSATLTAIQRASERGLIISYDPNLRLSLWRDAETARAGLLSGLDYAHFLKISDDEVRFLTGGDDPAPLWRDRMRLIAVTYGAGGAIVYRRDGAPVRVPGFDVLSVDTTGAGDGFVAGMLVGLLERGGFDALDDDELIAMTRFANAVGAIATTRKGAIPALPDRPTVMAFLAAHP
ncbi:MAG: PfkB family carbohydrate kinase [Chloroflexota bacterium]|nr:PfkB family carbohydrate kinase [Chloroflexota bacterium]